MSSTHLALPALTAHVAALPDPRHARTRRHLLLDVVSIAVCAVVGGGDTFVDIERFGQAKASWFRNFLALPNGILSHDTFGRVFAALDPVAFEAAVLGWVREATGSLPAGPGDGAGKIVALDGKTLAAATTAGTVAARPIWSAPGPAAPGWSLVRAPRPTTAPSRPPCCRCSTRSPSPARQ